MGVAFEKRGIRFVIAGCSEYVIRILSEIQIPLIKTKRSDSDTE